MSGYVVQTGQGTATGSPGTVILPSATRTGNTLIAMASVSNAGSSNGTLTSVTLGGGAADNFGQAASFGSGTAVANMYWWLDPLCAGGQGTIVFNTTGGNGALALSMDVLEVGGMFPITAGPGALDTIVGTNHGAGTTAFNTGNTTTSWPTSAWAGLVTAAGTQPAARQSGNPWIYLTGQPNGTISYTQAAYLMNNQGGQTSTLSYNGTFAAAQGYIAAAAAFPAMTFSPDLPSYMAGFGPQQGDMFTLATAPLGFTQQKVVVRVAQLTTTTSLPANGDLTPLNYDTVYEDPYQSWNVAGSYFVPPFTGWYQITATLSVGTCATDTIAGLSQMAALIMPSTGGVVQGSVYSFFVAGSAAYVAFPFQHSSGAVETSNSPPSTCEIVWVGFSAG